MEKKKILISSYSLTIGGIERALVTLLKNFNYDKYDVTLVLESKEDNLLNEIPKEVNIEYFNGIKDGNPIIRKVRNLLKRLSWILKNHNKYYSAISYATYSKVGGFLVRTASKNPILFVHSNYYQAFNKDKNKTINFFNDLKINNYKKIVFVSNEARLDLIKLFNNIEDKSVTINNLVDYKMIEELSKEKIDIKKSNKKALLFVGRLDESSKRISLLLSFAKEALKNKLNIIIYVVGDGPDKGKYQKYIKDNKLTNVLLLGKKNNPYPYMKLCDYVILTSRYEGFPVVYNEALVLNKRIITTIDVSDDYVSIPNRFGFIINDKNIYDQIEKIIKEDKQFKETISFKDINNKRIKEIEKIIDNR